eukprot:3842407-Rhodomonas_salina.1
MEQLGLLRSLLSTGKCQCDYVHTDILLPVFKASCVLNEAYHHSIAAQSRTHSTLSAPPPIRDKSLVVSRTLTVTLLGIPSGVLAHVFVTVLTQWHTADRRREAQVVLL